MMSIVEPEDQESLTIQVCRQADPRVVFDARAADARALDGMFAIGVGFSVMVIGLLFYGDGMGVFITGTLAVAFPTGALSALAAALLVRNARTGDDAAQSARVGRSGIVLSDGGQPRELPWRSTSWAIERRENLVLYAGGQFVQAPIEGIAPAQLDTLRRLLDDRGLVHRANRLRRVVLTMAVLCVMAAVAWAQGAF
jgi:hypothetical protein